MAFTQENTEGYTDQQLSAFNAELAELLAGIEPDSDDYHQVEKAFSDEVARRTPSRILHTVLTTNNAYDCLLLVDANDVVKSRWDLTRSLLADYLSAGAGLDDWNTDDWPAGFAPDEQETDEQGAELRTMAAYGCEYGRDGVVESEERRAFWKI